MYKLVYAPEDQPDVRPIKQSGKMYRTYSGYMIIVRDKIELNLFVPEGFNCDLGSIPNLATALIGLKRDGAGRAAFLIHDYLYTHHTLINDRKDADLIMRQLLDHHGVKSWQVFLAYWAVRLFGEHAWRKADKQ